MNNKHYVALLISGLSCVALQAVTKTMVGTSSATYTPQYIQQLEDAKYQVKVAQQNVEDAIDAVFADKNVTQAFAKHIMSLEKNDRKTYFKAISYSAPLIGSPKQADLVQAITTISSLKGGAKKHADRVNNFIDYIMTLDTQARSNFFKILSKGCSTEEVDWDMQEEGVGCTQHVYNLQMAIEKLASKERSQSAIEQNIKNMQK